MILSFRLCPFLLLLIVIFHIFVHFALPVHISLVFIEHVEVVLCSLLLQRIGHVSPLSFLNDPVEVMLTLEVHESAQASRMDLFSLVFHLVYEVFVVDGVGAGHSQRVTQTTTCCPHEIGLLFHARGVLRVDSGELAKVLVRVVFFFGVVWDLALDVIARLNSFPPLSVSLE